MTYEGEDHVWPFSELDMLDARNVSSRPLSRNRQIEEGLQLDLLTHVNTNRYPTDDDDGMKGTGQRDQEGNVVEEIDELDTDIGNGDDQVGTRSQHSVQGRSSSDHDQTERP